MLSNGEASVRSICCLVVLCAAVFSLALSGHAQSIDDTYKQALKKRRHAERLWHFDAGYCSESFAGVQKTLSRDQDGQHRRELR